MTLVGHLPTRLVSRLEGWRIERTEEDPVTQIQIRRPRPRVPLEPIDLRTPSGRPLPF
ncbi:MAG TPA: hypothetical protein VNE21_00065 [Mycobacteriales bacterium]|nr:hypothetical protein [Mycobacteriales bacterium]